MPDFEASGENRTYPDAPARLLETIGYGIGDKRQP